jgi:hypothetical protein
MSCQHGHAIEYCLPCLRDENHRLHAEVVSLRSRTIPPREEIKEALKRVGGAYDQDWLADEITLALSRPHLNDPATNLTSS